MIKFVNKRPYADAEAAPRRLLEHAHAFEVLQDGRIYIEKINGPFLLRGKPPMSVDECERQVPITQAQAWRDAMAACATRSPERLEF
jgi:hypothetical protein